MALLTETLSVRALFEFRENLELGDGLFQAITGVDAKDLMAFRRGRLKDKPVITKGPRQNNVTIFYFVWERQYNSILHEIELA